MVPRIHKRFKLLKPFHVITGKSTARLFAGNDKESKHKPVRDHAKAQTSYDILGERFSRPLGALFMLPAGINAFEIGLPGGMDT